MHFDASRPIYLQVIEEIKKDIVAEKIQLGSKLPSTRELAIEKGINANTAARIYKEMEHLNIAYTKRGIGTFVTKSKETFMKMKHELSNRYVKEFITGMMGLGYTMEELKEMVETYQYKKESGEKR